MSWIKTIFGCLGLFIFFFVLTFPLERVTPKISGFLETALSRVVQGPPAVCDIEGLKFVLPIGLGADAVRCNQSQTKTLLNLSDLRTSLIPFNQSVSAKWGKGSFKASTNASLFAMDATYVRAQAKDLSLTDVNPFLISFLPPQFAFYVGSGIQMNGALNADIELPVQNLSKGSGKVELSIPGLALPSQSLLEQLGLAEVKFSTASLKANLNLGRLEIQECNFLSNSISFKASGFMQLEDEMAQSAGSLDLKWKIEASDALRNSYLGRQLLEAPCPNPDSQRFCTRRINRLADLGI